MFSKISFSSSSKSSSSATAVTDIVKQWGQNTIASCVLGISKLNIASNLLNKISHAALLLLPEKIDYDGDFSSLQKKYGILIEFGDYNPNMCDEESDYVKKKWVIYHYDNKGSLKYFVKKYNKLVIILGCMDFKN